MSLRPEESHRLDKANKDAWNTLYAESAGPVWGSTPLPFLESWRSVLQKYVTEKAELLDAATGEGRNLPFICSLSDHVTACDASKAGLERISQKLRQQASPVQSDIASLPFKDGQFRLIFLLDTLETLPRPQQALQELARVLHPDGGLFLNLPDSNESIAEVEMKSLQSGSGKLYRGSYYYHFFSAAEARALLQEAGFTVVQESAERWQEAPHPGFREVTHEHYSHVFLCRKNG